MPLGFDGFREASLTDFKMAQNAVGLTRSLYALKKFKNICLLNYGTAGKK
jgi:hypothetical protein